MAGQEKKIVPLSVAFMIGMVLLYAVAFAPGVFHDVAHDLRHALAIPCH